METAEPNTEQTWRALGAVHDRSGGERGATKLRGSQGQITGSLSPMGAIGGL